jgi:RNA polymerase sigma factor (sigma-70 family)
MTDPFGTTRWSLILAASAGDSQAQDALSELCQAYWRPVYIYVRRYGHAADAASDLTQAFFLHLLEHRGFQRADPSRGRFRAYLVTAARNFLSNARARDLAARRGGDAHHESIDAIEAERYLELNAPDPESSPEAVFERQWALRLTERAIERLRAEYAARGQERTFDDVRPFLTSDPPANGTADPSSAASDALRAALHRARRRFGEALRAEIRETVDRSEDVDDELRHLLTVLSS